MSSPSPNPPRPARESIGLRPTDARRGRRRRAAARRAVMRETERRTPVRAEMGGCNATDVLPDADLDVVARDRIAACFGFAGQKCMATQRIVVVGDPGPLVSRLRELLAGVALG